MKLFITGGAGFIGSNFIHYWLHNHPKDKIVNFDKLTYAGHISSLRDIDRNKNYTFIKGDVVTRTAVEEAMKGSDIVVHFAAESHVDRSILNPDQFVKTNVLGTQILLDTAVKLKVKRFHHVSTDEVFGSLELGSRKKFDETTPYNPHSPYAASKASSDHLVRAYHDTYGLPISITNCANNFGAFQDPEKFIPRMITNLIDGEDIKIYGDGKYVRDWLHVEDHCRAIDLVLQSNEVGKTYCVGAMKEDVNNLEIAKKILDIMKLEESRIQFVKDRAGHDRRYAIDWKKINKELDWEPQHNLGEWLIKTVEWYRENEWWWRPLKRKAENLYKKTGQR
jgi:dTDP-glucose 4,6-dehydratase